MKQKTLYLTLSKQPFEVMVTGEKRNEYRNASKWLLSRLFDKNGNPKQYDRIEFRNGYGADKPYFITDYHGYYVNGETERLEYSNGLAVVVGRGDYVLMTTKIIGAGNIKDVELMQELDIRNIDSTGFSNNTYA